MWEQTDRVARMLGVVRMLLVVRALLVVRMLGVERWLWVVRIIEVVRMEWGVGGLWGCWECRDGENGWDVIMLGSGENVGGGQNHGVGRRLWGVRQILSGENP